MSVTADKPNLTHTQIGLNHLVTVAEFGAMNSAILKKGLLIGVAVVALFTLVALLDYAFQVKQNEGTVLPGTESSIKTIFSLVDQAGQPVTDRDFADRYKLIFFGFTHCPDVCPTALTTLSAVLKNLGPLATQLHPLFITVDPERDTPQRMRQYAQAFDPRITYLTGSQQQIDSVLSAWRVSRAKVMVNHEHYTMDHSSVLYWMTPDGKLSASFTASDSPAVIEKAIRADLSD